MDTVLYTVEHIFLYESHVKCCSARKRKFCCKFPRITTVLQSVHGSETDPHDFFPDKTWFHVSTQVIRTEFC
jgi:hypothetical protein